VREFVSRGKERMMRRIILVFMAMAMTLVVASGVAWAVNKIGTNGSDRLVGTNGDDNLLGLGGDDRIFSLAGNDNLLGGPGKDFVFGGTACCAPRGGEKNLLGGSGNDILQGGTGSDITVAGEGNDLYVDGDDFADQAIDIISGGAGTDVINVPNRPASKDIVVCGDGYDVVVADRKDMIAPNCEKVLIGPPFNEEEIFAAIPPGFIEGLPF
jgi:Ca2+-binding RTX toxin-like protein